MEESSIKKIAKISRGRFSPRPRNNPIYYGGDIPFVQTSDVVNSNGEINTFSQTLNEKGLKVSKLFPKDTILITIAANIGYTGVLKFAMACPDSLIGIQCAKESNHNFLNYFLSTQQRRIDYIAPEAAQKNINVKFLKPYSVPETTLHEQQKIASFLSSVDKKIQQLTRKKELLETYKKGVMQKLFPRPGEQTPQMRFKDENGKEFPRWEEKRLGDLGKFSKGKGIRKKDIEEDGSLACIRYGELYTEYRESITKVVSKTNLKSDKLALSQSNDVLLPSSGETHIDIATASCVLKDGIALGGDINIFRCNQNGIFMAYYLNSAYKLEIASLAQGNSIIHLYSSQLKTLEILLPSMKEQQKIVTFLQNIDQNITSIESKIAGFQTFKKGLLQQMFV